MQALLAEHAKQVLPCSLAEFCLHPRKDKYLTKRSVYYANNQSALNRVSADCRPYMRISQYDFNEEEDVLRWKFITTKQSKCSGQHCCSVETLGFYRCAWCLNLAHLLRPGSPLGQDGHLH